MTDDVTPGSDGALPEGSPDPLPGALPVAASAALDLRSVDRSLLGLVDRLALLLERSELTELEVEAGETGLILRKASALRSGPSSEPGAGGPAVPVGPGPSAGAAAASRSPGPR